MSSRRSWRGQPREGAIKLMADAETYDLPGGVIMAPEGAENVQTLVMGLKTGVTTTMLGETIFPYLTTRRGREARRANLRRGRGET